MATRQKIRRLVLLLLFIAFPAILNYYSPYLIIAGTAERIATFSFFFWVTWLVGSLVLGRLGCAWVCPFGATQMVTDRVIEKPLVRIRNMRWIKYVIAALWVGAIVATAISVGGYERVELLYNTETGISVDDASGLIRFYVILAVPFLPVLVLGKRGFCHYFCPFGAISIVGTKLSRWLRIPSLRLAANTEACVNCKRCNRACPMSLDVQGMVAGGNMDHSECILCATCIDTCPKDVIRYAWGAAKPVAGADER